MATNEERLIEAIRQMASFSVVDDIMPETLQRIAVLANDTIEGSAMVGLTIAIDDRPGTPVFTDDAAPETDPPPYQTGAGPCLDSFRDGLVYSIPSTANDTRWKPFSEACLAQGVLSTLSIPVVSNHARLGAMNYYSHEIGAFDENDITLGTAFAAHAAIVIANGQAYWSAKTLAEQLAQALESRVLIEQAKGLLMATGMTGDQAFEALRKASQRENRKLHLVAAGLVADAERRATAG